MKRNWKDIAERAVTTFIMTFVGVWAGLEFKWDTLTFKAALIGTLISLAKNLAFQGTVTQTPRKEVPVAERVEE